jgi:hypothetical protein
MVFEVPRWILQTAVRQVQQDAVLSLTVTSQGMKHDLEEQNEGCWQARYDDILELEVVVKEPKMRFERDEEVVDVVTSRVFPLQR